MKKAKNAAQGCAEKVVNSPAADAALGAKKSEGEKRKSPTPPIREKGKGKETGRGFKETHYKTARAHARHLPCSCTYREAGEAVSEIIEMCFGSTLRDRGTWSFYCRHFDRRRIVDMAYYYASCQRQGEVRNAVAAFQSWLQSEFASKEGGAR